MFPNATILGISGQLTFSYLSRLSSALMASKPIQELHVLCILPKIGDALPYSEDVRELGMEEEQRV